MNSSRPRSLSFPFLMAGIILSACSFQVPGEDKVFSSGAGGLSSGGVGGVSTTGTGDTAIGGSTSATGGVSNVEVGGRGGGSQTSTSTAGAGGLGGTVSIGGSHATGGSRSIGGTAPITSSGGSLPGGGTTGTSTAKVTGGASSTAGGNATGGTTNPVATGGATSGGVSYGGTSSTGGSGTSNATGGMVATGGSSASTGGAPGTGGIAGTGGAPDVLAAGLVHYFRFDETGGATSAVNAIDPTHNGTYVGAGVSHVVGRFGRAAGLRNSGSIDYVDLSAGLFAGLAATTISLWYDDLSNTRRGGRLFDFGTGDPTNVFFVPQANNPATGADAELASARTGGITKVMLWDNGAVAYNTWHHVAITWDANAFNFYFDGILIGTQLSPGMIPSDLSLTAPNWLGRTYNDTSPALYAWIDDLRIYNYVLPPEYITGLYNML